MADMEGEALAYARDYQGKFQFMLRMKRLTRDSSWRPTQAQAVAILKCRSNEVGKRGPARQPMRRR